MIRWTRIHGLLGIAPCPLTHDHVVEAVKAQLAEQDDLEWKREYPSDLDEFAKDVAAMANSRGGIIVYGVAEIAAKASAIRSVNTTDQTQRRYSGALNSRVRPRVHADFIALANDAGDDRVLVVSVPASPDAPHIIGQDNALGVPYRHGTQTVWMTEYQIARAYRDRFTHRENQRQRLEELISDARDRLSTDSPWIIGIAQPTIPLPTTAAPVQRAEVRSVLEDVFRISTQMVPPTPRQGDRLSVVQAVTTYDNPSYGLRKWIIDSAYTGQPDEPITLAHIELHHDGTIMMALAAQPKDDPLNVADGVHYLLPGEVESLAIDLVASAATYGRRIGLAGSMNLHVAVVDTGDSRLGIADRQRYGVAVGALQLAPRTRYIGRVQPSEGGLMPEWEDGELRETAKTLAENILHQFGFYTLRILT